VSGIQPRPPFTVRTSAGPLDVPKIAQPVRREVNSTFQIAGGFGA
jgi:hypothetical protein